MKSKLRISALRMALFCAFSIAAFSGCTESPSSPTGESSNIRFWTNIDNSGASSSMGSISSIEVTSAGFAASGFALRSDSTDSGELASILEFRSEQFILGFDVACKQYVAERLTPPGTYLTTRFDLHPLFGSNDSLRASAGPFFSSLFGGSSDNKTIVLKGNILSGESVMPFVYISTITGAERVRFDKPLIVDGNGGTIEMMVRFRTAAVFSSGGILMDPRDTKNRAAIDANLRMALAGNF